MVEAVLVPAAKGDKPSKSAMDINALPLCAMPSNMQRRPLSLVDKIEEISASDNKNHTDRTANFTFKPEREFEYNHLSPQDSLRPPSNPLNYQFETFYQQSSTPTNRGQDDKEDLIITEIPAKYGKSVKSNTQPEIGGTKNL